MWWAVCIMGGWVDVFVCMGVMCTYCKWLLPRSRSGDSAMGGRFACVAMGCDVLEFPSPSLARVTMALYTSDARAHA